MIGFFATLAQLCCCHYPSQPDGTEPSIIPHKYIQGITVNWLDTEIQTCQNRYVLPIYFSLLFCLLLFCILCLSLEWSRQQWTKEDGRPKVCIYQTQSERLAASWMFLSVESNPDVYSCRWADQPASFTLVSLKFSQLYFSEKWRRDAPKTS